MCDKELEMYEEGEVGVNQIICSGGMGPCISVGIYNKNTRHGYMRHQPNADHDSDMENFINMVLKKSDLKDLKVAVYGGSLTAGNSEEDKAVNASIKSARKYIRKLVSNFFAKKQVSVKWGLPDTTTELILDTSSGKFLFEQY